MKRAVVLVVALLFSALACTVSSGSTFAGSSEDQTENTWEIMASMPKAGNYKAAVVNGKIYILGTNFGPYEYDPATDMWTAKNPKPTSGYFAVAAFQNKIYAFGKTTEIYDPETDMWETNKTVMPTFRREMEANVVNGKIFVIGGDLADVIFPIVISSVTEVYDPATDSWVTPASIPYGVRLYASAVVDGKIYVIGGEYDYGGSTFNQIYDAENDTWSQGAPVPVNTWGAAAGATTGVKAAKRIYVVGGEGGFGEPLSLNLVYDPQMGTWINGSSLPTARICPTVAVVDDSIYVIGGGMTAAVERYTPFLFPVVSVSSPEEKTYNAEEVSLNFVVNEQVSWVGYSLDGQDNVTVVGNMTLTGLQDGAHSLMVYAEDVMGDIGASSMVYFSVSIDGIPEFSSFSTLLFFMIATLLISVVYFKKCNR